MAQSGQGQNHPQELIRMSPSDLNSDYRLMPLRVRPESTSQEVVSEQQRERTSLSRSPVPNNMPPPMATGTPTEGHLSTPSRRKRGAVTPTSQPKGKSAKVRQKVTRDLDSHVTSPTPL